MMGGGFTDTIREDRRGCILRIILDQNGFVVNEGALQDALQMKGHTVARDVVKGDLSWLEEQGLVSVEHERTVLLARLTQRGDDVASGRSRVPGVKRPSPGT